MEIDKKFNQGTQISNYIGNTSDSFHGYIWSVQIYYECIDKSLLFKRRTSASTTCYLEFCEPLCGNEIQIDQIWYCLPINFTDTNKTSYDLTGSSCGAFCSGVCIDCDCKYNSFIISHGDTKGCICANGTYETSSSCICSGANTHNSNDLACYSGLCYPECVNCSLGYYNCDYCIEPNAKPHPYKGCICSAGYYNNSDLVSGICIPCIPECTECNATQCFKCKDNHAHTSNNNNGCICDKGYYNSSSLSADICHKCNNDCNECINNISCTTCKDQHASPAATGCVCDNGYKNSTALYDNGYCFTCDDDCLTCDNMLTCLTCKESIALNSTSRGCKCPGGCGICNSIACILCLDINANASGTRCICKDGYYIDYSTNQFNCSSCMKECEKCISGLICTKCFDAITQELTTDSSKCKCKSGYYITGLISSTNNCLACDPSCATCVSSLTCTTCKDPNSKVSLIGKCECKDMYFMNGSVCTKCFGDCLSCNSYPGCTQCLENNTFLNGSNCACSEGYYDSSKDDLVKCSKCKYPCLTCSSQYFCLSCDLEFSILNNGLCQCSDNAKDISKICVANDGYFLNSSNQTEKCDSSCKTCEISSTNCTTCPSNSIKTQSNPGICTSCLSTQYLFQNTCQNCTSPCQTCKNLTYCNSCADKSHSLINGSCSLICPLGTHKKLNKCESCPDLCTSCDQTCLTCVANATLDKTCVCNKGFKKVSGVCEISYFEGFLVVESKNIVWIKFEDKVDAGLGLKDFKFIVGEREDFNVTLLKNFNNKQFEFKVKFELAVNEGTELEVSILAKDLYSVKDAKLLNYSFVGFLKGYTPMAISQAAAAVINSTGAATKTAVTSSIGASIMSNPSAAWALLNTIQIIIFLPLGTTSITPTLIAFFDSFSGYNLIPNAFSYFIAEDDMNEPYLEARNYGISTSVFFLNFGSTLAPFIVGIIIWPFIKILAILPIGKLSKIAESKLKNYRYNFFIRFWLQAYLEAGIYSIINLHSVKSN